MKHKKDRDKPDILMIVSDQHNASIAGCYGNSVIQTPNMDRLAAEGVLFEQAYCSCPICGPSRHSLLTGRYPHEIACWTNGAALASEIPTFAHALGIAGYEVALDGKAHFRGPDQRHGYEKRLVGDYSGAYWGGGGPGGTVVNLSGKTYLLDRAAEERLSITAFSGPGRSPAQEYDKVVLDAAHRFMRDRSRQSDRRPFFLSVGFYSPHYPFICPPELFDMYDGKVVAPSLPDDHLESLHPYHKRIAANGDLSSLPADDVKRTLAAYYGMVTFTDRMVGDLLNALEQYGLKDNTLVLYLSDHGEMAGEHGLWWKHTFYQGASRVPLIVSFPGRFPAEKRVKGVVSLVDLFPSLCDWSGAPLPPGLPGQSLDGPVHGGEVDGKRTIFSELYEGFPLVSVLARMVRKGPWKYNLYHGEPAELFNLEEDPAELHNLAPDPTYRDVCRELKELALAGWDPEEMSAKVRQHQERFWYMGAWSNAVDPPDPDRSLPGVDRKISIREEWRKNTMSVPGYTDALHRRQQLFDRWRLQHMPWASEGSSS
jgi:choline-sulfatase